MHVCRKRSQLHKAAALEGEPQISVSRLKKRGGLCATTHLRTVGGGIGIMHVRVVRGRALRPLEMGLAVPWRVHTTVGHTQTQGTRTKGNGFKRLGDHRDTMTTLALAATAKWQQFLPTLGHQGWC
jgi:hypothetical protein